MQQGKRQALHSVMSAKRLGMSYTFVTKSESGDRRLDVMELIRLADLYGKPPEFFLKPE